MAATQRTSNREPLCPHSVSMSMGLWAALTLCLGSSANVTSSLAVTATATETATASATAKATIAAELPVATSPRLEAGVRLWPAGVATVYGLRPTVYSLRLRSSHRRTQQKPNLRDGPPRRRFPAMCTFRIDIGFQWYLYSLSRPRASWFASTLRKFKCSLESNLVEPQQHFFPRSRLTTIQKAINKLL
ncbi:uncharacterized protein LOC108054060 isoform X2 [Drosophila rhopaloa]|uniref:Uncharacterized protein n=1 Tax=Drosophila rhopaloa TaxID=1041015 RepID=A0ABM5J7D0_DRORH|nr:uncharacterized protein LOC108054060 isoform X2 [Drosophila rhopaloa]